MSSISSYLWATRKLCFCSKRWHPLVMGHQHLFCRRSAHSLVGSILDAHPHAIVANEFDVVKHLRRRSFDTRLELFRLLVDNSIRYASSSRVQAGYSYAIDGAYQGRWIGRLSVIGDKKGGGTSAFLSRSWQQTIDELRRLQAMIGLRFAFFHVARNPFDNIATMIAWKNRKLFVNNASSPVEWRRPEFDQVLERFVELALVNRRFFEFLASCEHRCLDAVLIDVDGRQLLANARSELTRWCSRLHLNVDERWLNASISILYRSHSDSRNRIRWPREHVQRIQQLFFSNNNWTIPQTIV